MGNVTITNHPLIQHKLTLLRDKNTGSKEFRTLVGEIAMLMCYEATRDLPLKEVEIETPVAPCTGYELSKEVVIAYYYTADYYNLKYNFSRGKQVANFVSKVAIFVEILKRDGRIRYTWVNTKGTTAKML